MAGDRLNRSAVSRGLWALLDQGLHSGSSFAIHLALARWLPAQDYGLFAVAYALFLLISIAHTSLLVEPMLVFGPGRFRRVFSSYVLGLLELQGVVTVGLLAIALVVGAVAWTVGLPFTPIALVVGAVLTFSTILFQWLVRRACYVVGRSSLAAWTSALYATVVGIGIFALRTAESLSPYAAFAIMAAAAAVSAIVPLVGLRIARGPTPSRRLRRVIRSRHSRFGRWTLLTNGLSWVPYNAFTLVLSAASGLQAAAAFRALFNLIMPMQHASSALSLVLLPALVRRGGPAAEILTRRAALGFGVCAASFGALLIAARVPLVDLLYAGRYAGDVDLLWGLALLPILGAVNVVWRARLLADERPDAVFRAFAIAAGFTVIVGIPLVWWLGLPGAVAGRIAATGVISAILWRVQRAYRSKPRKERSPRPALGAESNPVQQVTL